MRDSADLTGLLKAWRSGESGREALLEREVYASLKRIAAGRWQQGGARASLAPSDIVNEAVARLLDGSVDWTSRAHFYALAALQMRAVLVDHARARSAEKRGGGAEAVTLDSRIDGEPVGQAIDLDLLALDAALAALAADDPRSARVIELTYFGGLNAQEVASVLDIGVRTVEKDLAYGRAAMKVLLGGAE